MHVLMRWQSHSKKHLWLLVHEVCDSLKNLIALAGDGNLTNHNYLSRHSEVEGPNGGNEAWHDEGDDQTLEHVQEQFARIAHIAGRQKSYKLLFMYAGNYLACLDV